MGDGRGMASVSRAPRKQTSLTAGTIFEGTRKPLRTWFLAMWFVISQKMRSVRSASRGNWGLAATKLPGPGCTSCAAPWSGRAGTCCLVRSRSWSTCWWPGTGYARPRNREQGHRRHRSRREEQPGLAASAFSRSEMSRQIACFPSSKALWSAGRWFTPTAGGVMPDWRRPVTGVGRRSSAAAPSRPTKSCRASTSSPRCSSDG